MQAQDEGPCLVLRARGQDPRRHPPSPLQAPFLGGELVQDLEKKRFTGAAPKVRGACTDTALVC